MGPISSYRSGEGRAGCFFGPLEGISGLDRTSTIGDAYLAAIGLSAALTEHTIQAAHKAIDLIEAVDRFNEHSRYKLKVRVGIDTGARVAGSVGKREILCDL